MAKGSGLCDDTGSYLVTVKMLRNDTHFSLTVEPVPEREPTQLREETDGMKHCTLPPIESRAICFELKRRKLDLKDEHGTSFAHGQNPNLLYWLNCAELSEMPIDEDIVNALKDIQMLESSDSASMQDDSQGTTHDCSLATFKHMLERRNRMVTEHCEALVAATASNEAVYPMGTGSSAKTANM
jgi:hypothetical protein